MNKKSIMIIGGGLLQVPAVEIASSMGLKTIVTDYNKDALGLKIADLPVIMSTRDIEGSVRIAKDLNKSENIIGVLTIGTDASQTVAAVANALGLPGIKFENAEAATNKLKMRRRFKRFEVPSPNFMEVWKLDDLKRAIKEFGLPLVLKPSDNMGARGVRLIRNNDDMVPAFNTAKSSSPSGELIAEEYMEGPELSIDALIYNGKIFFTGIADRIIGEPPYFIELGHTMPSSLSSEIIDMAKAVMIKGIHALGLDIGAAKGDIKITNNGAMIGEIAARLSGGFMSAYTYPLSSGINLIENAIRIAIGKEPNDLNPVKNLVSIERALIPEEGRIIAIENITQAKQIIGVNEIFILVKEGDYYKKPTSNVGKAGNVIITAETLRDAEYIFEKVKKTIRIRTERQAQISYREVMEQARKKLRNVCLVCSFCDGEKCITGVPGMGGVGSNQTFKENIRVLKKYKLNMSIIHNVIAPDTSINFRGIRLSMPLMVAPITGTITNLGGAISEDLYAESVVTGCRKSGIIAMVGDGASPEKYLVGIEAVKKNRGLGIPIFKPRIPDEEIIKRLKAAECVGAVMAGIDIDAVSFATMENRKIKTIPRGVNEIKRIISSVSIPIVLKGIMNLVDAEKAYQAGAEAIVVSNHGGRVLDQVPASAFVLREIARHFKGKMLIMVDGGVRSGMDIFKMLALGADIVLIGRPFVFGAVGGETAGVEILIEKYMKELKKTMVLTGVNKIRDISLNNILSPNF